MRSNDIRNKFLKYFEGKGHAVLPGSSLIPKDPTVLLTLAGMLQFKPVFLGLEKPAVPRAATVQKCVRTNDIENVGHTARHHTFFEMLGNFSFGDYFKSEAITFAWELITKELNIDKKRLFIAIYEKDDESEALWKKNASVDSDHLTRLGEDNNFWVAGPTGPCGPCSEIYYDLGEKKGCKDPHCAPGCDCDRFLEIWNLVFMEFNRDEKGALSPLPKKNIDTGMGLERIASVIAGVSSNFETDLFIPIIESVKTLRGGNNAGTEKEGTVSLRIISDHIRAASHLISDGLTPGNEGRNYILRRIMRRAMLHGRKLGLKEPFLHKLSAVAIDLAGDFYPELKHNRSAIEKTILVEEEGFGKTIDQGTTLLDQIIARSGSGVIAGDNIFLLYDTYGFPVEMTKEIALERGLSVDLDGFGKAMEKQKTRSRERSSKTYALGPVPQVTGYPKTEFVGYETLESETKVIGVNGNFIVLDKTPLYVESGGQDSDKGWLVIEKNKEEIVRLVKTADDVILHQISDGIMPSLGEVIRAEVNEDVRGMIARHHTATHLLHAALRKVLGGHVKQSGSFVGSEKFRLDFSHPKSVGEKELQQIQDIVNDSIKRSVNVETIITGIDEAKSMGAMALFDAKYKDKVRVVRIDDVSLELCGGTHVKNTSEIGLFKIIRESAIAQGIRRIEALCGPLAEQFAAKQDEEIKKTQLQAEEKAKGKEIEKQQEADALKQKDGLIEKARNLNGIRVVFSEFKGYKSIVLKRLFDEVALKLKTCICVFVSVSDEKLSVVVGITPDLVQRGYHAGNMIKELALVAGGKGGGRPDLAEGGGPQVSTVNQVFEKAEEIINAGK